MGYIRLDEQPGEVYHYTHRKNLDSILRMAESGAWAIGSAGFAPPWKIP